MNENPIIKELEEFSKLRIGNELQQAYFEQLYKDAKPAEIRTIKKVLRPKKHQCFSNSALMTELFPDRCVYVEGFGWNTIYRVDHAINRVGDKYVDVTWELCLKLDVSSQPYAALIEASRDEVLADIEAHNNTTGNYYLPNYLKTHKQ